MMKMKSLLSGLLTGAFFIASASAQTGQLGSGQVWGNPGASQGVAIPSNVSAILDRAIGSTRGALLERGASGWAIIGPSATAGLPWLSAGTGADPAYGVLGLVGGGCNAALTASNGGILYSTASACAIFAGTATARLPLLSGSNTTPVWGAYTLPASVTSGGIPYFSSSSVQASSGALTLNGVIFGGGIGGSPGSSAAGTSGQLFLGVTGSPPQMATMSQDCTITNAGVITCLKTNNVAFAPSATTDTTNGGNISSGTVAAARQAATILGSAGNGGVSGQLGFANGGCGGTTQQTCLNNVMPTPTRAGDISFFNGTNWVSLAGNNSGTQVLQETSSGVPSWVTVSGTGTVTSVTCFGTAITSSGTCVTAGQIPGIATATAASAGNVGEFVSATGTPTSPTSTTPANLTSVSLTAGDWECSGNAVTNFSTSISSIELWISTTSATNPGPLNSNGYVRNNGSSTVNLANNVGPFRLLLATTTTVFLGTQQSFTGTDTATGFLQCRRMR
jgi:hypothetical protein